LDTLIHLQGAPLHQILVIIHVLLFVYWLGGDIGVYYSSKFVVRPDLSPETRATAAKIMLDLDQLPRICMTLMLTVGGLLTAFIGVPHPVYQWVGILLLGPVWLFCVIYLHVRHGGGFAAVIAKLDMFIRWAVVIGIPISIAVHWETNRLAEYPWIAVKLALFSFLVFCGIMIRGRMGPFVTTLLKCRRGEVPTPAENEAQLKSLAQVRVWVYLIWAGVFVSGFIGIWNRSGIVYTV
jgi:hypothetical protein